MENYYTRLSIISLSCINLLIKCQKFKIRYKCSSSASGYEGQGSLQPSLTRLLAWQERIHCGRYLLQHPAVALSLCQRCLLRMT